MQTALHVHRGAVHSTYIDLSDGLFLQQVSGHYWRGAPLLKRYVKSRATERGVIDKAQYAAANSGGYIVST